jgi:hypothetical protein
MPWQLKGNAGTNPATDFLGTTDNQPLVIKVNSTERLKLEAAAALVRGNLTVGAGSNGVMKTRHIEGKSHLNDNDDALYLNWATGQSVVIGNPTVPASLEVTGDIVLSGADFAEEFDVAGPDAADPGTVVVLDREGAVRVSDSAYDSRVVGVISGAGDYKPAVITDHHDENLVCRRPVALMGKVYCKVDASYGSVDIGNLLTTSSTPGHAMKANDRAKAFGSIIGKALMPLSVGQGLVPILIALK